MTKAKAQAEAKGADYKQLYEAAQAEVNVLTSKYEALAGMLLLTIW